MSDLVVRRLLIDLDSPVSRHGFGTDASRIKWFKHVTLLFLMDLLRQTVNNLDRDGTLWQWRTWKSAASFLLGRQGMVRLSYQPWRAYKKADFHPSQLASDLSLNWLQNHTSAYAVVNPKPPVAA